MKNLKILFVALAINAIALTGCGGGDKPVTDPEKTITVKLLLGGYGDKWLRETITNFEKVYANEGYKINLLNPTKQNSGVQVKNELTAGYAKKKIDLYFTGDLAVTDLVNTKDGTLIEDLNDVYNQSPISFDGTL